MAIQQRLPGSFRELLQLEFERRSAKNSRFSLRAFSKLLGLEPSFLSKILSKKRNVTPSLVKRLGPKLGLDPAQIRYFSDKARPQTAPDQSDREDNVHFLQLDQFRTIADWHHFAILELIDVDGFRPSVAAISRALQISHGEALAAVERLRRLNLLDAPEEGPWKALTPNSSTTGTPFTAAAFQEMQRQILNQAIEALEEIPMEKRDQSSMTMAIDSELLPEAKERIRKFRRELAQFLQSSKKKDSLFLLSLSLFPVFERNANEG